MPPEPVVLPGEREITGSISHRESAWCVVACPPHPQHGGNRSDQRLVAVADALASREIGCLRFDYAAWTGGAGEQADIRTAVEWVDSRYGAVGVFGYSFGASMALLTAAALDISALSVLAPSATTEDYDVVSALRDLPVRIAVQLITGGRDTTVEWEPLVEVFDDRYGSYVSFETDHFFIGFEDRIGEAVAGFFESAFSDT